MTTTKADLGIVVMREQVMVSTDSLVPYENNAKTHPPQQVKMIASSMKEYGFAHNKSIEVMADMTIVNGHGRWLAAQSIGLKQVPVTIIEDLTPEQIRTYRLVDNRVAESRIDAGKQADEMRDLLNIGEDLSIFWSDKELESVNIDIDMGEINLDAFTEDISAEVEESTSATQHHIDEEDDKEYSLAKVLGYTKVSARQQRRIAALQAHAEQSTGEQGAAALADFAVDFLGLKN